MKHAGRKHGSLSAGSKDPHNGRGLDWDKLRAASEARLEEEWDAGIRNPDTIRHRWFKQLDPKQRQRELDNIALGQPSEVLIGADGEPYATGVKLVKKAAKSGNRGSNNPTGRPRGTQKHDVAKIVELYLDKHMSPKEIREELAPDGPSYETIVKYLKARGVFDPTRHRSGGRRERNSYEIQRKRFCERGHDLDAPGNSRERTKKLPDGTTRPNGRECVPCARKRSRDHYKGWDADPRNPKNGGQGTHTPASAQRQRERRHGQ